jgi:hypothetical protein
VSTTAAVLAGAGEEALEKGVRKQREPLENQESSGK